MKKIVISLAAILLVIGSPSISFAKDLETATESNLQITSKSDTSAPGNDTEIESPGKESISTIESEPTGTTKSNDDAKNSSLLSLNVLGLNVSLLGEKSLLNVSTSKEDKGLLSASVGLPTGGQVDLGLLNSSSKNDETTKGGLLSVGVKSKVLGDVNVDVLSGAVDKDDNGVKSSSKGGLLNVGISNSAVLQPVTGDVNIDLLSSNSNKTNDGSSSKNGLLGVGIKNSDLLGDVNVDVLSGAVDKDDNGVKSSSNSGLLNVGINNSTVLQPVTGDVNIDLLSSNSSKTNDGSSANKGLLGVGINNSAILGSLDVDLLGKSEIVNGDMTQTQSGLLILNASNSITGDGHLGIGEVNKTQTPDYTITHSGLVLADLSNPLLGKNHLGVLERKTTQTQDGTTTSGGIVIVDLDETPVGDIDINIGDFENSDNNGGKTPGTPVEDNNNKEDHSSNTGNSSNQNDSANDNNSKNGKTPGKGTQSDNNVTWPVNKPDSESSHPSVDSIIAEDEENNEENDLLDEFVNQDLLGELLLELLDTGKEITPNQQNQLISEDKKEKLKNVQETLKEIADVLPTKDKVTPTQNSTSGSGGTSTSNSSDGGPSVSAFLSSMMMEYEIQNAQIKWRQFTLSDQWLKPPLIKPPTQNFFLS